MRLNVWLILLWVPALAQQETPKAPAETKTPAPVVSLAIPVNEIPERMRRTSAIVRAASAIAEPPIRVRGFERTLPEYAQGIRAMLENSRDFLKTERPPGLIRETQNAWKLARQRLETWQSVLSTRSGLLQQDLLALQQESKAWTATKESAGELQLPPELVADIDRLLGSIRQAEQAVVSRRNAMLKMQGTVSELGSELDRIDEELAGAAIEERGKLFQLDGPPLWRLADIRRMALQQKAVRQGVTETQPALELFQFSVRSVQRMLVRQAVAFVIICAILLLARRRSAGWVQDEDDSVRKLGIAVGRPISLALLLSLLGGLSAASNVPDLLTNAAGLVLLIPLVRIIPLMLPPKAKRPIWILAGIYVAVSAPRFLSAYATATRLLVVLLCAATGAGLLWLDRQIRAHVASRGWRQAALASNRLAIGLVIAALASEVIGATELARFLNSAVVRCVYAAVLLFGSLPALHGIIHLSLRSRRAWSTHPKNISTNLERRLSTVLNWIVLILFAEKVLNAFHITDGFATALTALISFKIAIGAIEFTLGSVLIFAAVIVVTLLSSRILRYFLTSRLYNRMELTHGTSEAISKLLHYAVLALGLFVALGAAGIEMTKFTVLAGGLSVGIGFGMQNIVNNFVSGLILLFERPLHVGDKVTVGATSGLVTDIGIRASTIRTWDGADVVIPNASLISGDFTNWNLTDERRRSELKIGVAYGTDPGGVIRILREEAANHPSVLREPPPVALFVGFGQSSLDFVLRFWTLFDNHVDVSSQLHVAVWERLAREGIEIPFPQRDLNLKNVHPSVLESFRQPPRPEESSESAGV